MQTYSVGFFLMALFTRKACRGVFVAGGGVSPASGAVTATAMVTIVVADGAAPVFPGPVLGEEVEGLQRGHC
jgi:restriction endonuclease Mrr